MKKISTLYKKDPNNLGRVINEINPENNWVFMDEGVKATRKYDGTACAIIDGQLYKSQEPDLITGHWPHWILCDIGNPADKYHFEAFDILVKEDLVDDGTYELLGPKVQDNPEKLKEHHLFKHGVCDLKLNLSLADFDKFRDYLTDEDIEGIVFHHPDGRMCKLRKSDYGIKR